MDSVESFARPRVAAGALIFDDQDRVLVVQPSYKPYWDIPGGYVQAGESPLAACAREVREELGIEIHPGPLLAVDWAPHPNEGDKLLFIFDGGKLATAEREQIRLDPTELIGYDFWPRSELTGLLTPRLARRLQSIVSAHPRQGTAYLEHGVRPEASRLGADRCAG